MTTREISSETGKSQTTVRHWLKKYGILTRAAAKIPSKCTLCENLTESYGARLCACCLVKVNRIRTKLAAVHYKGGKCAKCPAARNPRVMQFHHRDPSKKNFNITSAYNKSWSDIIAELDQCDLLCPECHALEHMDESPALMGIVYNYTGNNPVFQSALSPGG